MLLHVAVSEKEVPHALLLIYLQTILATSTVFAAALITQNNSNDSISTFNTSNFQAGRVKIQDTSRISMKKIYNHRISTIKT